VVDITIGGVNQSVAGYYLCAGIVGMVAQQNPSQPLTNFPMTGYVTVSGSNDKFTTAQMDDAAAGGVYWVIQDQSGAPLISRHQLTMDTTSVETRELSIVKAVDSVAKTFRRVLKPLIGRNVINGPLLSTITTMGAALLLVMVNNGTVAGGTVNTVEQDANNPDKVLLDVTLSVLYPCNYIRVTLAI